MYVLQNDDGHNDNDNDDDNSNDDDENDDDTDEARLTVVACDIHALLGV